jgi:hypothetical protein
MSRFALKPTKEGGCSTDISVHLALEYPRDLYVPLSAEVGAEFLPIDTAMECICENASWHAIKRALHRPLQLLLTYINSGCSVIIRACLL